MPRPFAKVAASPAGTLSGVSPRFFQPSMIDGEHAARPALLVDVLGVQKLLEQPDLVVDVENGEVGLQPDQLGMPAQDLHADRMERAEPRHSLDDLPDHRADARLHLARGLVGEGDGEDFGRARAAEREDVRDARGEHAGLAGSGAGKHQHRPVERLDRLALLRVQPRKIGRGDIGARTRRDPARGGRGRSGELLTRQFCHYGGFRRISVP